MNETGEAYLITAIKTQDSNGYDVTTELEYEVYVEKLSVKRTEYYTAMQAGIKPTVMFKVRLPDFEATRMVENGKELYASKIRYLGIVYEIIRTYSGDGSFIELTCG